MTRIPTQIVTVDPLAPDPDVVRQAAEILRGGGLVACPTETVYGLMADAHNSEAVRRVFSAKGRPTGQPLPVQIARAEDIDGLCRDMPPAARTLIAAFFPGPLTLVLPRALGISDIITGGADTVGVRMPDYPVTLAVLRALGGPAVCPSANTTGRRASVTAADVLADLDGQIDLILDGGPAPGGVASTVLDVTVSPARILREGVVSRAALEPYLALI